MLHDMAGRLGHSSFVESATASTDLPLDWAAAGQRIADAQ